MPETSMPEVVQDPVYAARLKHEADQNAANLAAQEKAYREQWKFQARDRALEVAFRNAPDHTVGITHAQEIYEWLIKDL